MLTPSGPPATAGQNRLRVPRRVRRRAGAAAAGLAVALAAVWAPPVPARADLVRDRQKPILDVLDMDAAWKVSRGRGVTVAVVDTGVDAGQPDLAGSVTTGPNMLAPIDAGTTPARRHGTGMASLIAGHGHGAGGREGIIGLAPEARVLSIRVIGEKEDASFRRFRTDERARGALSRGIRYATDHGADVINLSLGENRESAAEREAIGYAIGKGVVVVAAVGNDGDKKRLLDGDGFAPYFYPASFPGVIAVAGTDATHGRVAFSNRNYSVLVSAPGIGLPVAGPGGAYFISGGTSDACALVSGVAALIRAAHPRMPPALVSQALVAGTRYGPGGKYDPEVGFGEVNAKRALTAAANLTSGRPAPAGKPAGRRFGADDPGPVDVIDRPGWVRPLIIALLLVGVGGTIGAAAISAAFARRHPRPGALVPPGGPLPAGPPGSFGAPPPAGPLPQNVPPPLRRHAPPLIPPAAQAPPPGARPSFGPPDADTPGGVAGRDAEPGESGDVVGA
ncbi:S8 family serine peptidase [Actinomadura roseirufa]|uniref:S8 family serine peptidase n=1 Tax=Actinomadura roseirufa TaxID=2094049 RepID=UPI001041AC78|nr:S8 family serine peptidase [Actinomadura roseirufa]